MISLQNFNNLLCVCQILILGNYILLSGEHIRVVEIVRLMIYQKLKGILLSIRMF